MIHLLVNTNNTRNTMKKTDTFPQSTLLTITDLQRSLDLLLAMPDAPSAMIWGPPGVGKSSAVRALAERHGIGLVDLRLGQLAPTDLRGLPVPDHTERRAAWYPPAFLPREGRGILFLDELNLAPPVMQGIAQQLVLDRRVGDYTVPEGWVVWAAGNRKEDRAAVYEMPAPVANRFVHFEVGAEIEGFRSWAANRGFDELLLAFLLFRPELLHKPDTLSPAWPSPRSWDMADRMHRAGLSIASAVGQAAAGEFAAFCKLCGTGRAPPSPSPRRPPSAMPPSWHWPCARARPLPCAPPPGGWAPTPVPSGAASSPSPPGTAPAATAPWAWWPMPL